MNVPPPTRGRGSWTPPREGELGPGKPAGLLCGPCAICLHMTEVQDHSAAGTVTQDELERWPFLQSPSTTPRPALALTRREPGIPGQLTHGGSGARAWAAVSTWSGVARVLP